MNSAGSQLVGDFVGDQEGGETEGHALGIVDGTEVSHTMSALQSASSYALPSAEIHIIKRDLSQIHIGRN